MRLIRDRRRAQAGTTLVEVLVGLVIASMALALIVGTLSNSLLQSTIAKRNTAAQGVLEYEMEAISASAFNATPSPYSDCFATESQTSPPQAVGFQGTCPSGPYTLRADVTWQWLPSAPNVVQVWTVSISTWPGASPIQRSVSVYKINR